MVAITVLSIVRIWPIKREKDHYEIDYDYCKGCGICFEECPRSAILLEGGGEMKTVIEGSHAVSYGVMLSRAQVISAYPITPQTHIVEKLSELCATGELKAKFLMVESEHSAMASCIGASAVGARAFTATSSQGLALMHELLHWASGARLPIVMANVNRTLAPPWNIWCDQTDSLSQRDTGWLQFYCESSQEAIDTVIQAYKISERVSLPFDGGLGCFLPLPYF